MFAHAILPQDKANQYLTCAKFVRVNARLGPGSIFSTHLFNPVPNGGGGLKPELYPMSNFRFQQKRDRSADLSFLKQKPLLKYMYVINKLDEH